MITIDKSVTAGTFADTSTNAEGVVVADTYVWTSDIDAAVGAIAEDGTATFLGVEGTFTVTATDPLGLAGSDSVQIVDTVPVAVGTPTFTPA